ACEVPVVASNVGGLPEVIDHGFNGFLHPPGDLDGMAQSAVALLTDSALHRRLGAAAHEKVRNKFCEEKIVPLYEAFYEEVLAELHRFDGAEQYCTRAVDFGYTIDVNETLAQWGREEIIGDYVRLIRTIRPDVISAMSPTALGPGQHAHHALSAILSREAYKLAGDPTKYPEQIKEGLSAWQPKKFYVAVGGPGGGNPPAGMRVCRLDLALYDSLLGKTF